MRTYLLQGLLLGFSYLAPIGMQNLYVIQSSIKRTKKEALAVAFAVIIFDILLALACFYGMGKVFGSSYYIMQGALLIGGIVIALIGVNLIKSKVVEKEVELDQSLKKVIFSAFLVTWANPQALIDGSLLLGGYRALVPESYVIYFIIGVMLASILWFNSLSIVTMTFKKKMNINVLQKINFVCGSIIIIYGLKMVYHFILNLNTYSI